MEELQSTEILDREILEDARKKAYRILKTADETVKANAELWEQKTRETLDELNRKYAERRSLSAAEIMARLPLDKRRVKTEKIESLIRAAVETWYAGLGRERALALLKNEIAKRIAACDEFSAAGEAPRALIRGLERAEAEALLRAVLPGRSCGIEEMPAAGAYPEILLENSAARITASIYKTVDFFLHENRAELASALLEGIMSLEEGATDAAGEAP
jgi:integrase